MKNDLTFEDGIVLCRYIYQSAIDKTLNGVIEQEEIFYKAHEILNKINCNCDNKKLDELLYLFNLEDIFSIL